MSKEDKAKDLQYAMNALLNAGVFTPTSKYKHKNPSKPSQGLADTVGFELPIKSTSSDDKEKDKP